EGCWTFNARDRMPRSSRLTAHPRTTVAENLPTATRVFPRERVRSLPRSGPRRSRRYARVPSVDYLDKLGHRRMWVGIQAALTPTCHRGGMHDSPALDCDESPAITQQCG